jgi:SAM-dependent methyltransferase
VAVFSRDSLKRARYFDRVYKENLFHGAESLSGEGSSIEATKKLRVDLRNLIKRNAINTLFDVPCGDMAWMSQILDMPISYTGGDISKETIKQNKRKFPNQKFVHFDAVRQVPSRFDLIFCRDLLVHLPNNEALRVLNNFIASGSSLLLTTTFVDRSINEDLHYSESIVQWRPLNLANPPFYLPEPLETIIEECNEGEGLFRDKAMALYDLQAIKLNHNS